MPKIELQYKCKKCRNVYDAAISYSGSIEDIEVEENQSRCPYCGAWNCADTKSVEQEMRGSKE